MDLTALDWVLFGVAAFFTVIGLFRGFSGQVGTIAGIAAALVVGYFIYAPLRGLIASGNWVTGETAQASFAAVLDFTISLVVFGLTRRLVGKFVSFLVPQPMNAIAGAAVGLLIGSVAVAILAGAGFVQTGRFSSGCFAANSTFVRVLGGVADSYVRGASQ